MTTVPVDTVGLKLSRARELLAGAQWEMEAVEAIPPVPPHRQPQGLLRVVQQRVVGPKQVVFVVAREVSIDVARGA